MPASRRRTILGVFAVVGALSLGCISDGGGSGFTYTDVNGTVLDQRFTSFSGVAEQANGMYVVILTDTSGYTCTRSPIGDYLEVTWVANRMGTESAAGNVTFAFVEEFVDGFVETTEPASGGTFTITEIDEFNDTLSGEIDAFSGGSDVRGDFTVEICN